MSETTATAITASGKTGVVCTTSGPYKSTRNTSIVVFFKKGDKFTNDPVDGKATTWSM
jgi:hypothetical protein